VDGELLSLIEGVWRHRADRYSDERAELAAAHREKVEMYHIGG